MGYTHYLVQSRDLDPAEFADVAGDVLAILCAAGDRHAVAICDAIGRPGSAPDATTERVAFNGDADAGLEHEAFELLRVRARRPHGHAAPFGSDFCETARKPYDLAVTAVLCYLSSVVESHRVTSDGSGDAFFAGLALAREALPRYANRLDLPRGVLEADRWCAPHAWLQTRAYQLHCCVDGHAYVLDPTGRSLFRFRTHQEAAAWLAPHRERGSRTAGALFEAAGWIDAPRRARLARDQERALADLVDRAGSAPPEEQRLARPPTLVRPGDFPTVDRPLRYADLLAAAGAPAAAAV